MPPEAPVAPDDPVNPGWPGLPTGPGDPLGPEGPETKSRQHDLNRRRRRAVPYINPNAPKGTKASPQGWVANHVPHCLIFQVYGQCTHHR